MKNISKGFRKYGMDVRGLFIVGADNHTYGTGDKIAHFVIENNIVGVLIQSMYFIPGTKVYEKNKNKLLHTNWEKYTGNVVHRPEKIPPFALQNEIIIALRKIYSRKRLINKILKETGIRRVLIIGEYFWQMNNIRKLRKEIKNLKLIS